MDAKKYLIGSIVVFIAIYILDYLFHEIFMKSIYMDVQQIFRTPEAMKTYMLSMIIGHLILAFGFCYVFIKGREGKGVGEGIRYGIIVGFTFGVGPAMIQYAVYPWTGWIMLAYFFWYPILCAILGLIFASIYKPAPKTA